MRKCICALLILVLTLAAPAALAVGGDAAGEYERAIELLKENNYADAGAAFSALGSYADAPRYAMYCSAIAAGEAGLYAVAVDNLNSLNGFLDSGLLAKYYAGLSWEVDENYERAAEVLNGISLYRDVLTRLAGYPERINARDYRRADEDEQANRLEKALSGFKALGDYRDSADRAVAVQEKINARDYAAADEAEQAGRLEEALEGFKALGDYSDSAERAKAVRAKIDARDAEAAERARADAYAAADKAEQEGDFAAAYTGFTALGDYKDSAARAVAVQDKGNYAQGMQYALSGKFDKAYELFAALGDYEDSAKKAYALGVTSFAEISNRKDGIAAFKFHGLWGLINVNTNTTVSPYWDEIGNFNEFGLARVAKGKRYGYINTVGEVVVPCEWYAVSAFSADGYCTVARTEAVKSGYSTYDYYYFGLYDRSGRAITPADWRAIGEACNSGWENRYNYIQIYEPAFSDGKIRVQRADGLYGFIDTEGQPVGEVRWASIRDFSEGLAVVVENDRFGFIDESGNVVIEPQYADAQPFSEGLAGVRAGSLWQFIDRDNNVVIQPLYGEVSPFQNGLADVFLPDTGWQIIDSAGGLVYFINEKDEAAYAAAKALMEAGQYAEASAAFSDLAGYEDANALAQEARYLYGVALLEAEDYNAAWAQLAALGDYRDAAALAARAKENITDYYVVEHVRGDFDFTLNDEGWYECKNQREAIMTQGLEYGEAFCAVRFVTSTGHFALSVAKNDDWCGYGMVFKPDVMVEEGGNISEADMVFQTEDDTDAPQTFTFDIPDQEEHIICVGYAMFGSPYDDNGSMKFKVEE